MSRDDDGRIGEAAARLLIAAATRWQAAQLQAAHNRAARPARLVVAVDGHGAAGKTTIAGAVAAATGAALVHTDDFFQPWTSAGPDAGPTHGEPGAAGAAVGRYYDWRRLRAEALEPLRAGRGARYRRFDWERGAGLDGTVTVAPGDLILLEGVFSAAPELSDLVDRAVFVDTPPAERLRRLRAQVKPEEWDDDWLLAEQAYFDRTRPPASFDLTVRGACSVAGRLT